MPVGRSLRINGIPVDYVADAVTKLTFDPKRGWYDLPFGCASPNLDHGGRTVGFPSEMGKNRTRRQASTTHLYSNVRLRDEGGD